MLGRYHYWNLNSQHQLTLQNILQRSTVGFSLQSMNILISVVLNIPDFKNLGKQKPPQSVKAKASGGTTIYAATSRPKLMAISTEVHGQQTRDIGSE